MNSYRRSALKNRPWITGALYDKLTSSKILHLDAYIFQYHGNEYLELEWNEGGKRLVARDTYLIEPDGLTPVWSTARAYGVPVFWTRHNHMTMARVHRTVLLEAENALKPTSPLWARVSVLCHYVHVTDTDCEITGAANSWKPPAPYKRKPRQLPKLPDIL